MEYVIAVVPSIVLAVLFYFLMRSLFNADRRERNSQAKIDAAVAKAVAEAKKEAQAKRQDQHS